MYSMTSHRAKVKLFERVCKKGPKRVNNIRNVFSVGLLHWLHSPHICLAAFKEAVGALVKTCFHASLANLQGSQERVKACGVLTATVITAPGLSTPEQGNRR